MERPDIVILGAGPAGATAALLAAGQGLSTLLVDSGQAPAGRIESLPPMGRALARDLGLRTALDAAFLGRVATITHGGTSRHPDPQEAPDLLDRAALHAALRNLARQDGAHVLTGRARLTLGPLAVALNGQTLYPRLVIDARGRAALSGTAPCPLAALPFRTTDPAPPSEPQMRITPHDGSWSWQATLPSGRSEGALFLHPDHLAGLSAAQRRALLLAHLALPTETLHIGTPCPAALHAAPAATAQGLILRVGDAALARDPVSSHGLVHAFRSAAHAVAAAATILQGGDASAAIAFLNKRHVSALRSATDATARALADLQGQTLPPAATRRPLPPLSRALCLAEPPRDAPTLAQGRIVWTKAIHLPASAEDATAFGPVDAATVAALLGPPAPVTVLQRRLQSALPESLARAVLTRLIDEGALVADQVATRSSTDKARATSQPSSCD